MKKKKVNELQNGIYRIFWKKRMKLETCLAAVGQIKDGGKWLAPTCDSLPLSCFSIGWDRRNCKPFVSDDAWRNVKRVQLMGEEMVNTPYVCVGESKATVTDSDGDLWEALEPFKAGDTITIEEKTGNLAPVNGENRSNAPGRDMAEALRNLDDASEGLTGSPCKSKPSIVKVYGGQDVHDIDGEMAEGESGQVLISDTDKQKLPNILTDAGEMAMTTREEIKDMFPGVAKTCLTPTYGEEGQIIVMKDGRPTWVDLLPHLRSL